MTISWKRIALALIIVGLGGLNVYQYLMPSGFVDTPPVDELRSQEVVDAYHQIFYDHPLTWPRNTWLGIPAQQNPNDVWITQEIITEVRPDFIVETGTANGGSAALWATVLAPLNPAARVVTVDIEDLVVDAARQLPIVQEKVDFLVGSSTAPEIVAEVKRLVEGGRVMVILDSNHEKDHVVREIELYGPMVSVGSYLIVQDTNINGHPVYKDFGPGPWEALDEALDGDDRFVSDRSRERFFFTMHPRGYLRRVK